jgi:hypothetical protein
MLSSIRLIAKNIIEGDDESYELDGIPYPDGTEDSSWFNYWYLLSILVSGYKEIVTRSRLYDLGRLYEYEEARRSMQIG